MATAAPVHKSVFSALILSMYVTVRVVSPGCGCGFALEFEVAAGLGIEKALSNRLPTLLCLSLENLLLMPHTLWDSTILCSFVSRLFGCCIGFSQVL